MSVGASAARALVPAPALAPSYCPMLCRHSATATVPFVLFSQSDMPPTSDEGDDRFDVAHQYGSHPLGAAGLLRSAPATNSSSPRNYQQTAPNPDLGPTYGNVSCPMRPDPQAPVHIIRLLT